MQIRPGRLRKAWCDVSCNCENKAEIPMWIISTAERIVKNGNTAEIKKEHGKYVVVEIKRKLINENRTS